MIILSHKKPGFHPFSRRYIFGKTKGVGQIDLARVKNKKSFKVKQKNILIVFKKVSVSRTCLEPDSRPSVDSILKTNVFFILMFFLLIRTVL